MTPRGNKLQHEGFVDEIELNKYETRGNINEN